MAWDSSVVQDIVHVICPTRDRPETARKFAENCLSTSASALLTMVHDADQIPEYTAELGVLKSNPRFRSIVSESGGPVAIANREAMKCKASLTCYIPDDFTFTVEVWDKNALELAKTLKHGVGVVSPTHNYGPHVDIPMMSYKMMNYLGWFAPPGLHHWCWPTVISLMCRAIGDGHLVHAKKEQVDVFHEHLAPHNLDKLKDDAVRMYWYLKDEFNPAADRLIEFIKQNEANGAA